MELVEIKNKFKQIYGQGEEICFHSPGRINLIGEHIDYSGGYVFPCALEFGTYGVVRKRNDNIVNLASTNFDLKVSVNLENIQYKKEDDWANYPKGVIQIMQDKGYAVGGMDILISGNIPNGAGLSSSASLELLIGEIINNLFNKSSIDKLELVKIGQEAENKFVGVNCGIMDQFAVGMGKEKKAIMLDCNTLEYRYANVDLKDYIIIIMNTNKERKLNESKYNERREEGEKALQIIKKEKNINNLCELSTSEFEEIKHLIKEKNIIKRVEHSVYENERVKEAYKNLNNSNIQEFGRLLTASHNSLRDLYEVTGKELDTIVEEALKVEGCIGARMTGAGFGGCAIALVKQEKVEEFKKLVSENYENIIGYKPSFYISGIGEGTRKVN